MELFKCIAYLSVGKPSGAGWHAGMDKGEIILTDTSLSFFPYQGHKRIKGIKTPLHEDLDVIKIPIQEITKIETGKRRTAKHLKIHTISGDFFCLFLLNLTGNPSGKKRKDLEKLLESSKKLLESSLKTSKTEILNKMIKFVSVSDRLNLQMMRGILQMEQSEFNDKILDWSVEFDFSIDGDNLIINDKEKISDFIDYLKNEFTLIPLQQQE